MTTNLNPNDFDERRAANRVWWLVFALSLMAAVFALTSCSTQRSACGITEADSDSLSVYVEQMTSTQQHNADVSIESKVAEYGSAAVISDSTSQQEQITETTTEHTTVTTDSVGRRTETTDRTTQRTTIRNNTYMYKDEQAHWQREQEETLALVMSYLDSVYNAKYDSAYHKSIQYDYKYKEKETKKSLLADINVFLGILTFWVFLVIAAGLSYYLSKHHGKEKE